MRHRKQRADQWPCRLERVCKVSGSHTLTWPSRVPLTTCELSLLWQTQLTPVSCSSSACTQHVDSTVAQITQVVAQITHTTNALSSPHLTLAALAGSSSAGAVQAVCNGPPMSVAQSTTVHDGLLHPHLRHCSSAASVVRQLPPAFDVPSLGLFCGWPSNPELYQTTTRSACSSDSFHLKAFLFLFY